MLSKTLNNFGHPGTVVREYEHWLVLVHPDQPTLGALIVVHKGEETSLTEISESAGNELKIIIPKLENLLRKEFQFEKINYLMLMMHNPEVHFTILPRYSSEKEFGGAKFVDVCWPTVPNLPEMLKSNNPTNEIVSQLVSKLKAGF